jgi:hypothetical protein
MTSARTLLLLGAFVLTAYSATTSGTLTSDPETRYQVAESVAQHGDIVIRKRALNTVTVSGRRYSVFFPGQSVLFLPITLGISALAPLDDLPPEQTAFAGRFVAVLLVSPIFAAVAAVGFARLLMAFGVATRRAVIGALCLAFATPLWVYGTNASEEVILAALTVYALISLHRMECVTDSDRPDDAARVLGLFAIICACGLVFRITFGVVAVGGLPIVIPVLRRYSSWFIRHPRILLERSLLAIALIAIIPIYNAVRFADPFQTGYPYLYKSAGVGVFDTPLTTGLAGHLLSPGKSIFLYTPLLLLLPEALAHRETRVRLGRVWYAVCLICLLHLVTYSRFTFWGGDWCWGIRFYTSIMPALVLPIAVRFGTRPQSFRMRTVWLALIVAMSVAVQIAGVAIEEGVEYYQQPRGVSGPLLAQPGSNAWTWSGSHFRMRFHNLIALAEGHQLVRRGTDPPFGLTAQRSALTNTWNVFPWRARAVLGNSSLTRCLFAGWLLLGTLTLILGRYLWKMLRGDIATSQACSA